MLRIPRRLKSTLHGKRFDAVVIGGGHNGLVAVRTTEMSDMQTNKIILTTVEINHKLFIMY